MPLESCMIIIDNSEFTRNGDYTPTRFQAQAQAVAAVFTAKTDMNPESSVGLLTMAGKSPSLLVTPTNDIGKLLSSLSRSAISGTADPITAIQVAQLALKHRENKNARQRVVVFAGSEISIPAPELVKLGKKLRKNNVLIDVVLFGDEAIEGEEGWRGLIEAAGGGESHLVTVPPGPQLLSDVIQTSPILFDSDFAQTHGGAAGDGEGGMGGGDGMDLDPNMDPELAMAIRMSLQEAEEQARRDAAASGSSTTATGETSATAPAANSDPAPVVDASATALPSTQTAPLVNTNAAEAPAPGDQSGTLDEEEEDEDAEMQRAMQMSLDPSGGDVNMEEADEDDEEDEDAAIAAAIAMSLEHEKGEDQDKGTNPPK